MVESSPVGEAEGLVLRVVHSVGVFLPHAFVLGTQGVQLLQGGGQARLLPVLLLPRADKLQLPHLTAREILYNHK